MMHNGMEYGMLQAYGEGFEIWNISQCNLDLHTIAHLWNQGSIVRPWLLELAESAFQKVSKPETITGYVADSGKGCWDVQQAIGIGIPAPVITLFLLERFRSQQDELFTAKAIATPRKEFGGCAVKASDNKQTTTTQHIRRDFACLSVA